VGAEVRKIAEFSTNLFEYRVASGNSYEK